MWNEETVIHNLFHSTYNLITNRKFLDFLQVDRKFLFCLTCEFMVHLNPLTTMIVP